MGGNIQRNPWGLLPAIGAEWVGGQAFLVRQVGLGKFMPAETNSGDFRYAIGAHHHFIPLNHRLGWNKLLVGSSYGEVIQFLAIAFATRLDSTC